MKKSRFSFNLSSTFIILVLLSIQVNLFYSVKATTDRWKKHQVKPFVHHGQYLADFKPFISKETSVSYFSDRDFDEKNNNALFFQFQNSLAPIILDNSGELHQYIILDFVNNQNAYAVFRKLNPQPIKITENGIMLAKMRQ